MTDDCDKSGRTAKGPEPHLGIFWMIATSEGAQLLAASCPLSEAEPYGDFLTFGPGHYEVWQNWRRSRVLNPDSRGVVRSYEYEDWPRGRIVFNRPKARFILYADRKLLRPETLKRIARRFALPPASADVETDFHYQSAETPEPLA